MFASSRVWRTTQAIPLARGICPSTIVQSANKTIQRCHPSATKTTRAREKLSCTSYWLSRRTIASVAWPLPLSAQGTDALAVLVLAAQPALVLASSPAKMPASRDPELDVQAAALMQAEALLEALAEEAPLIQSSPAKRPPMLPRGPGSNCAGGEAGSGQPAASAPHARPRSSPHSPIPRVARSSDRSTKLPSG